MSIENREDLITEIKSGLKNIELYYSIVNNLGKYKNDKELFLLAVSKKGYLLKYASEELQDDIDVVLEAVKNEASSVAYASINLRRNEKVALLALKENNDNYTHLSNQTLTNKNIVKVLISREPNFLYLCNNEIQNDIEILKIFKNSIENDKMLCLNLESVIDNAYIIWCKERLDVLSKLEEQEYLKKITDTKESVLEKKKLKF
jgi:hypothetical protein